MVQIKHSRAVSSHGAVVIPQVVLNQVPHRPSSSSWNTEVATSKLYSVHSESQQMLSTLRLLGHYDLHTSMHIHPKLTQRELDALKRNEWFDLPLALRERNKPHLSGDSLEVEVGSFNVPPIPDLATRQLSCSRTQDRILEELKAKLRKTCMVTSRIPDYGLFCYTVLRICFDFNVQIVLLLQFINSTRMHSSRMRTGRS